MDKTMTDRPWFEPIIEFLSANFYALAGALLSLFVTQKVSFFKGLISFAVGFLFAVVAPGVVNEFRPIGEATRQGIAFAAGMTGMNITLGLIRLTIQFRNDPASILSDFSKIVRGTYKDKIHSTELNDEFKKTKSEKDSTTDETEEV